MFGQIRPIVIDETNTIMAGVGCYETLLKLEHKDGIFYKIEGLTENQKKKLMIADNKIFGLGIENLDTFNQFLDELKNDLDIPGYDEEILKSMVADADVVSKKIGEYGSLNQDDLAGISAGREKKEAMLLAAQQQPTDDGAESDSLETASGPSIVCPHCKQTIWLSSDA
jgi:hypothetical protein